MRLILYISDLHLNDNRNQPERDEKLLNSLAALINRKQYRAVVNLGDTVSREEFLVSDKIHAFKKYIDWRNALNVPFIECAIYRERPFFKTLFAQQEDSVWNGIEGVSILTFSPLHEDDHQATNEQWRWLSKQIDATAENVLLINSHVPYPGSCSRPVTPGIFLPVPDAIQMQLESRAKPIFWAGGHFHWKEEQPMVKGSLTAFMGGRFLIDSEPGKTTYLRELDLDRLTLNTIRSLP